MSDYPAIPEPNLEPQGLLFTVQALKQAVEMLTGQRNGVGQALTAADQPDLHPTALTGVVPDGSITTAKLAALAATYAKIQNVSATARILGRKTAGAGVIEECTLSEILDLIGSAANGDILIRSGGVWTRLPAGSNTNVLTLASGLPSWAAPAATGGLTRITSVAAGTGTSLTITGLGGYKILWVFLRDISHSNGTTSSALRVALSGNGGSTFGTAIPLGLALNFSNFYTAGFAISNCDQANNQTVTFGQFFANASANLLTDTSSRGPIDALRFDFATSSNFDAGQIDIYGLK